MKKLYVFWFLSLFAACNTGNSPEEPIEIFAPVRPPQWDQTLLNPMPGQDLKGPVKWVQIRTFGAVIKNNKVKKKPYTEQWGYYCENDDRDLFFDPEGKIAFEDYFTFYGKPQRTSRTRFTYYYDGRLMQKIFCGADHGFEHSSFYIYDEKGRYKQISSMHISGDANKPDWTTHDNYTYNDSLQTILVENITADGPSRRTTFQLDANGHISRLEAHYLGQDSKISCEFRFDKTGRKVEEKYEGYQYRYNYDSNGFPEKLTMSFDSLQEISEYRYSLDSKGNWIKRIEYVKGRPFQITEREIEYYPNSIVDK